MTAVSTLGGMSPALRKEVFERLREEGVRNPDLGKLNLYISREAQRDNNPVVSREEALFAVDAFTKNGPLAPLPGSASSLVLELEDGSYVWGANEWVKPEEWKKFISDEAERNGLPAPKFELIPGSESTPNAWERFWGSRRGDRAQYCVTLQGDRASVERVFDAYHSRMHQEQVKGE